MELFLVFIAFIAMTQNMSRVMKITHCLGICLHNIGVSFHFCAHKCVCLWSQWLLTYKSNQECIQLLQLIIYLLFPIIFPVASKSVQANHLSCFALDTVRFTASHIVRIQKIDWNWLNVIVWFCHYLVSYYEFIFWSKNDYIGMSKNYIVLPRNSTYRVHDSCPVLLHHCTRSHTHTYMRKHTMCTT